MTRPRGSTSPASRRSRLARLLRADRDADPKGITFAEIVRRYANAYPDDRADHDTLTSAVGALVHAGTLLRVGEANGEQQYATTSPLACDGRRTTSHALTERDRQFAAAVARIVEAHYASERCPISTATIRAALQRDGLWPDRYPGLFNLLLGLTREGMLSESVGDGCPVLRRASAAPENGAIAYAFWLPHHAADQCATTPATSSDALRRAVRATSDMLGRAVSIRELRLWLLAQPPGALLRTLLPPVRIAVILRNTLAHDAPHAGAAGRLHVVAGPLAVHGGPPVRYLVRAPTRCDQLTSDLADLLDVLRVERELSGILRLRRDEHLGALPVIRGIARARVKRLVRALEEIGEPCDVEGALDRLRFSAHVLAAWATLRDTTYAAWRRRKELGTARRRLDAVTGLLAHVRRTATVMRAPGFATASWRSVGEAALVTPRAIRTLVRESATCGEIRVARPASIYASARRFPRGAEREDLDDRGLVRGDELALLDRVDCLTALAAYASPAPVVALVRDAHALLGDVLRDERVVRRALRHADTLDPGTRRALVVAHGLLGAQLSARAALPSGHGVADTRALLVSIVFASASARDAIPAITALRDVTRGAARELVSNTIGRSRAGYYFTAVEASDA